MPTLSRTPTSSTAPPMGASEPESGSQVWNGTSGALMAKATKKPRNSSFCTPGVDLELAQRVEGERALAELAVAHHVQADDGGEHDQPADQAVEEELHRGVLPAGAAEAPDDEVHRDEHRLEEDVEQEDVGGGEDADHHRLEQQQPGEVGLHRPAAGQLVAPGRPDHHGHQHADEQQHHQRDAVDAEGEVTPRSRGSRRPGGQLEPVAADVEGHRREDGEQQHHQADARAPAAWPAGRGPSAAPRRRPRRPRAARSSPAGTGSHSPSGSLSEGSLQPAHPAVTASSAPATSTAPPSMPRA